jgi:hypothetical protein
VGQFSTGGVGQFYSGANTRLYAALLVASCLMPATAILSPREVRAAQLLGMLHVDFGLLICGNDKSERKHYAINADLVGLTLGNVYHRKLDYDLPAVSVETTFAVVPDAYYVEAKRMNDECQTAAGETAIVLPGHTTVTKVGLGPPLADAPAASYVAGLIDPGISVSLYGINVVACSSHINVLELKPLAIAEDADTYHAMLRNSDIADGSVLLIFGDSGRKAALRLPIKPNDSVSTTSTYLRFDARRSKTVFLRKRVCRCVSLSRY